MRLHVIWKENNISQLFTNALWQQPTGALSLLVSLSNLYYRLLAAHGGWAGFRQPYFGVTHSVCFSILKAQWISCLRKEVFFSCGFLKRGTENTSPKDAACNSSEIVKKKKIPHEREVFFFLFPLQISLKNHVIVSVLGVRSAFILLCFSCLTSFGVFHLSKPIWE